MPETLKQLRAEWNGLPICTKQMGFPDDQPWRAMIDYPNGSAMVARGESREMAIAELLLWLWLPIVGGQTIALSKAGWYA
jgi:hypothetical protein